MLEWIDSIPADCLKQLLVFIVIVSGPALAFHRKVVSGERKGREMAEQKTQQVMEEQKDDMRRQIQVLQGALTGK